MICSWHSVAASRAVADASDVIRLAGIALSVAAVFSTVAIASGIDGDLGLDPAKWSFLGGGSVDSGRGAYVHATNRQDGSSSTFLVEHDSGLPPYQAFLLHERTLAAADATSPVPVRAETGGRLQPGGPDAGGSSSPHHASRPVCSWQ